jgi:hypothetical protein
VRKTVDSWSPRSTECCTRIVPIDELNLNADYQLVNGGRGLLEVYALGRKTESHYIGELAMRTLAVALENLDDNRAQELVLSYCNAAARLRARRSDEPKEQLP